MTKAIGIAGKGGVGKTTLAVLCLKFLLEREKGKEILVIDQDPNQCLPQFLGVKSYSTLAEVLKKFEQRGINPAIFRDELKALLMSNEQEGYDLLVMGRGRVRGAIVW